MQVLPGTLGRWPPNERLVSSIYRVVSPLAERQIDTGATFILAACIRSYHDIIIHRSMAHRPFECRKPHQLVKSTREG